MDQNQIKLPAASTSDSPLTDLSIELVEEVTALDSKMGKDIDELEKILSGLGVSTPTPSLVVELRWDNDRSEFKDWSPG